MLYRFLFWFPAFLAICVNPVFGADTSFNVSLTNSTSFTRPSIATTGNIEPPNISAGNQTAYYATRCFSPTVSGSYTIETTQASLTKSDGTTETNPDPMLFLYSSFDPTQPLSNVIVANDDINSGSNRLSRISNYSLTQGTVYTIVVTTWNPGSTGTVSFSVSGSDSVNVCPVADFSATPTSGAAPLSVQFTDASTGTVTSRSWDFGDGGTSTEQNPSHTYSSAGTYTVSLTATGPLGNDTKTRTSYITASSQPVAAPTADFSATPTSGAAPLTVQFTNATTGSVTSWSWSFGDGGTSAEQNPSHTYNSTGIYTVSLTATGPGGSNTKTRTSYVTVTAPSQPVQPVAAPTADFSATPTSGAAPLTVQFTNATTGSVTSWSWSFGDGGTSAEQNPSHTYNSTGIYTVSLTATGPGGSNTKTRINYIINSPSGFTSWNDWFAVDLRDNPMIGDFNGDGLEDVVSFEMSNPKAFGDVYVALSDGTKFLHGEKWNDWFAVGYDQSVAVGDFNGDGMDDIAVWLGAWSREVYMETSHGAGFAPSVRVMEVFGDGPDDVFGAGDVNGDGKDDLVVFSRNTGKVYVAVSNGNGFNSPQVWHNYFAVSTYERPVVADMDGDGKADIVSLCADNPLARGDVYVAHSTGAGFNDGWSSAKWADWFGVSPEEKVRIADYNGDGRADLLSFMPPDIGQIYLALSEGNQLSAPRLLSYNLAIQQADIPFMGDFNGDGKADLVVFRLSEGKVYVMITP